MPFDCTAQPIPDVFLIKPRAFGDARGNVMETYRGSEFIDAGIPDVLAGAGRGRRRRPHVTRTTP